MPVTYNLRKDIRFKEGLEQGREQGRKEGREETARLCTIYLLKRSILSPFEISEAIGMPLDFVTKIAKELEENPNLK